MERVPTLGIIGATGLIGQEIVSLIADSAAPFRRVRLFASEDSAGEIYRVHGGEAEVEPVRAGAFKEVDVVILATKPETAAKLLPVIEKEGSLVIDLSSWSRGQGTPVVVPWNGFGLPAGHHRVMTLPHPLALLATPLVSALASEEPLFVSVTTYQAMASLGKKALDELWGQLMGIFQQKEVEAEELPYQSAFNVIPQVDVVTDSGSTREELEIAADLERLLGRDGVSIGVTAARVPVLHGDALALHVVTRKPVAIDELVARLSERVELSVYPELDNYPMPRTVVGTEEIHIGRLRKLEGAMSGVLGWVAADLLKAGLARPALTVARRLLEEGRVGDATH